jgi:hypothetical protein
MKRSHSGTNTGIDDQSSKDRFPIELLSQPIELSKDYFHNKVFDHAHFETALDKTLQAILDPAGRYIVSLYGPSGVGKSQILYEIQKLLIKMLKRELEMDTGRLAFVSFQVPPVEGGKPVWTDVYTSYLRGLLDRMLDDKVELETRGIRAIRTSSTGSDTFVEIDKNVQIPKLRRAVIVGVRNRRPKAVFMDEAQNLTRTGNGSVERLRDQMAVLQFLADQTKTVHVLAGNYDLRRLLEQGDIVCRRTTDIHVPAYRLYNREDVDEFNDMLSTFQAHLPVAEELDFRKDMEYFYGGCLGCIGTLKQWLEQALAQALANATVKRGVRRLSKPFRYYLDAALLSQSKMCEMIDAILTEDRRQVEVQSNYQDKRLRFEQGIAQPPRAIALGPNLKGKVKNAKPKAKGTKPFRRSPGRDAVGQDKTLTA